MAFLILLYCRDGFCCLRNCTVCCTANEKGMPTKKENECFSRKHKALLHNHKSSRLFYMGHRKNHVLCRKNYIRHNQNYIRPFFGALQQPAGQIVAKKFYKTAILRISNGYPFSNMARANVGLPFFTENPTHPQKFGMGWIGLYLPLHAMPQPLRFLSQTPLLVSAERLPVQARSLRTSC